MLRFSRRLSRTHLLRVLILPAVALLCLGVLAVTRVLAPSSAGPIYSVGALQAGLERDPGRWVGRTLHVRAVAESCADRTGGSPSPCIDPRPALFDTGPQPKAVLLLLPDDAAPTTRAWLRRLPILGSLIPPPPVPRWGVVMDYTLQARPVSCSSLRSSPCFYYAALLL